MNIRLLLKNSYNEVYSCIIKEINQEELEKVFSINKGYGYGIDYNQKEVKIVDYFHGDIRASYRIVLKEECIEECVYQLNKLKKEI